MTTNISKNVSRKLSKKALILICAGLIILAVAGIFMAKPILNKLDQSRFSKLDTQMQKLFSELEAKSDLDRAWSYTKSCDPEYSGPWPTGYYNCSVNISMDKTITTVAELNDIQKAVYPIIDKSDILKATTELDAQLPDDFGVNFVVSSSQKIYNELSTNMECSYLIKLYQGVDSDDFSANEYGTSITDDTGKAIVKLECADKARGNWYLSN